MESYTGGLIGPETAHTDGILELTETLKISINFFKVGKLSGLSHTPLK